ncbi:MAG: hypothetical protein ACP5OM_04985 [Methanothrix sp.]
MCGADLSDLEEENDSRKMSRESSPPAKGISGDQSEQKTGMTI